MYIYTEYFTSDNFKVLHVKKIYAMTHPVNIVVGTAKAGYKRVDVSGKTKP